jgi:hypothetical protein
MKELIILRVFCENDFRRGPIKTIDAFSFCLDRKILGQYIKSSHGHHENLVEEWHPDDIEELKKAGINFWINKDGEKYENIRDANNCLTDQYKKN